MRQHSPPLPLSSASGFTGADDYVDSLLSFVTSNQLFQKLCGGVHILDFFTKEPDLYNTVLPEEWRAWFHHFEMSDILDLLMRESTASLQSLRTIPLVQTTLGHSCNDSLWRGGPIPPGTLLDYILSIRKYNLSRDFTTPGRPAIDRTRNGLPKHVSVGMNLKKRHEVENFAEYIDNLTVDTDMFRNLDSTHIVDFGSGRNYLGRALASPPYYRKVIGLEIRHHNISGAKSMDVTAKLAKKKKIMRNKKHYRQGQLGDEHEMSVIANGNLLVLDQAQDYPGGKGSVHYIETSIDDGDLSSLVDQIKAAPSTPEGDDVSDPQLMVVSLHSCGNLIHHGLRSLLMNPAVKAVAMVGCCYNLVTERLGPPTYKIPSLRSSNQRLEQTSTAFDLHGFPMSEKLTSYRHRHGHGIRLNITARMMACQAPENWTPADSESFFTRHFYRALLQRIFVDRGVVGEPTNDVSKETEAQEPTGNGPALIVGTLRKACYGSFQAYVRGAVAKLAEDSHRGPEISDLMESLSDEDIARYEEQYRAKKQELSITWSLMAFSASLVESTIVVDRWLYLREQERVQYCWVETVFDYKHSPRNLVVVGIKR